LPIAGPSPFGLPPLRSLYEDIVGLGLPGNGPRWVSLCVELMGVPVCRAVIVLQIPSFEVFDSLGIALSEVRSFKFLPLCLSPLIRPFPPPPLYVSSFLVFSLFSSWLGSGFCCDFLATTRRMDAKLSRFFYWATRASLFNSIAGVSHPSAYLTPHC